MPTKTPDLTAAQAYAWIVWAVSQLVAWHWLASRPSQVTLAVSATVLAAAWHFADAHIRGRRAGVAAAALYARTAFAPTATAPAATSERPSPSAAPTPTVPPTAPQA